MTFLEAGFGTRIVPSNFWPKHPTRMYKAIYKAHPLVIRMCWILRRWVWIRPWTEAWYPDDADPIYMAATDTIFCGERHLDLLRKSAE